MNRRTLAAQTVRLVAHRVNAARIDPSIVKIEQRADGQRVVDCLVGKARAVQ